MRLAIASGKGGTGKTTVAAALVSLWTQPVVAVDLDVEEPNLHLFLKPEIEGRQKALLEIPVVDEAKCTRCGLCAELCQFKAISLLGDIVLTFPEKQCGRWHLADTRFGPMIHAQLFPGEENSGRLVTLLKNNARALAEERQLGLILADGPPGIGCPVISSLAGANLAVVVTEPTPSGIHDLERVIDLCDHFRLSAGVVINKWNLNSDLSLQIKTFCTQKGITFLGELPYDPAIVEAMVRGQAITEYHPNGTAELIGQIWTAIKTLIEMPQSQRRRNIVEINTP
jgi:MinD superfamily P-loop ATPase